MEQAEPLVTVAAVVAELGIPRATLYRLVQAGRIPAHDVTQPWHTRTHIRFRLSEVRAAIAGMGQERQPE